MTSVSSGTDSLACDLASQLRLVLGDRGEKPLANHLLLHLNPEQQRESPRLFSTQMVQGPHIQYIGTK